MLLHVRERRVLVDVAAALLLRAQADDAADVVAVVGVPEDEPAARVALAHAEAHVVEAGAELVAGQVLLELVRRRADALLVADGRHLDALEDVAGRAAGRDLAPPGHLADQPRLNREPRVVEAEVHARRRYEVREVDDLLQHDDGDVAGVQALQVAVGLVVVDVLDAEDLLLQVLLGEQLPVALADGHHVLLLVPLLALLLVPEAVHRRQHQPRADDRPAALVEVVVAARARFLVNARVPRHLGDVDALAADDERHALVALLAADLPAAHGRRTPPAVVAADRRLHEVHGLLVARLAVDRGERPGVGRLPAVHGAGGSALALEAVRLDGAALDVLRTALRHTRRRLVVPLAVYADEGARPLDVEVSNARELDRLQVLDNVAVVGLIAIHERNIAVLGNDDAAD